MATKKVELRQKVNNSFTDEQSEIVVRSDWDIIDNKPDTFVPTDHNHDLSDLNATGNLDNTTYLRGDGQWVQIATTIALEDAAGDGIIWDNVNQEYDVEKATTLQAQAGVNDTAFMTPLKTAQAIEELGGGGATIFKEGKTQDNVVPGDLAQFAGSEGDHYLVKKAVASEINANPDLFMGVFAETAVINDFVKVMWVGLVENVNLPSTTYSLGDILWYDNTNASYTLTEPTTKPIIQIAAVTKVNDGASVTGRLLVRPQFKSRNADEVFMNDNTDLQTKITQVENDIPTNNNELTNGAGYLTAETDPTVPAHVKGITTTDISNWDTAHSWGDHSQAGYLTSLPSHTHAISDVTGLQTALDGKATPADITTAVSNLVDSSPAALDTLNELAAALGDDPNFATTVTNSIGTKVSKAGDTMSGTLTISAAKTSDSPLLKLVSTATGDADAIIELEANATGEAGIIVKNPDNSNANGWFMGSGNVFGETFYLYDRQNGAPIINVKHGGNVGIGTTDPSSPLHIASSGLNVNGAGKGVHLGMYSDIYSGIEIVSNANNSGWIDFREENEDFSERIRGGTGELEFYTSGSERMVVNSSGNVGIGTTSPSAKLDVNGTAHIGNIDVGAGTFKNRINASGDASMVINSNGGVLSLNADNNNNVLLGAGGGNVGIGTASPSQKLDVNGNAKISGDLRVDGSVEIGGDLEVVGNSIGFIDTAFDAKIEVDDGNPNGTGAVFNFFGDGVSRNATLSAEQFDGNAATATKWTNARTLSLTGDVTGSTSFDGSNNASITVSVLNDSHTHDGRYYTESEADSLFGKFTNNISLNGSTDTASFINELTNEQGCFQNNYRAMKVSWSYAGNSDLNTGHPTIGTIELAGCLIEAWGGTYKHIRITRPTTGTGGSKIIVYNDQGSGYSPGWREIWTSESDGSGSGLDADKVDGIDSNRIVYGVNTTKTTNISNVNNPLPSGFYDSNSGTGNPTATWYHLLNTRHNNEGNNYQMQFAGEFFNSNNIFYRASNNSTGTAWNRLWHSGNDGSGSGLDADTVDGRHVWTGTQAQYDAIGSKSSTTLYFITG